MHQELSLFPLWKYNISTRKKQRRIYSPCLEIHFLSFTLASGFARKLAPNKSSAFGVATEIEIASESEKRAQVVTLIRCGSVSSGGDLGKRIQLKLSLFSVIVARERRSNVGCSLSLSEYALVHTPVRLKYNRENQRARDFAR